MSEIEDGACDAEMLQAMHIRKHSLLKSLGKYPVFVASLTKGNRKSKFGEMTGVGDDVAALAPYGEDRQAMVLGAMTCLSIYDHPVPPWLAGFDRKRRVAAMAGLKRITGAKKIRDRAGVESNESGEEASR